ncbi:GW dipeptide domain-containing protein [Vagococcus coleopterorum]|nr:GW dipeptide domain-containing protein [Vagococcus coleopterorum]
MKKVNIILLIMVFFSSVKIVNAESSQVVKEVQQQIAFDKSTAVGKNGKGEDDRAHSDNYFKFSEKNPKKTKINEYIKKNKLPLANVDFKDSRFGKITPKYKYAGNKPIGVVIHETANPNSNIYGEVNYMFNNYFNAFVHAYASSDKIINTAPTKYLAWGAGPEANPYFMHIELVEEHSLDAFARSVNNDAYWVATQLLEYNLPVTFGDTNGNGTVISHSAISKFWGGSNHTDPVGYFGSWGYSMKEFYELVKKHYNGIERYREIDEDVRLIEGGYSVYSAPKGFEGAKYLGKTKQYVGKDFTIKKESIAPDGVSYEIPGIGWVGKNAFEQLSKPKYKTMDQDVRLLNGSFAVYNVPKYYKGYKYLSNAKAYEGQDFTITREATSKDGVSYEIPGVGWVGKNAFEQLSKPKYKTVDQDVRLLNGSFAVYNVPKYYKGYKYLSNAKAYEGQDFTITREATSKDGVSYEIPGVGWVGKNAFEQLSKPKYKTVDQDVRLLNGSFAVYNVPKYYKGYKYLSNAKAYEGQDFTITREATSKDGVSYELKETDDKVIGWVGKNAFENLEPENYKTINKKMWLDSSKGYAIYSKPKYYKGYQKTGNIKTLASKDYLVTRQATASDGISYEISLNDEVIGWVGKGAFKEIEHPSYESVNKEMRLTGSNFGVSTAPKYYENYSYLGTVSSLGLAGKDCLVTRQAQASDGISYEISVEGQVIGWAGKNAFENLEPENYKTINKKMWLDSSKGYAIYSKPKYYKGYQKTGNIKTLASKDYLVTRQATASDGISYEISLNDEVIGWVGKGAFKEIEHPSYESVNKEMRLTGSNFGVSTAPKYYENYSYLGTVSSLGLAGKDCLVTRQAQASDGISYEISVEGQVIGWVGKNAFAILQKTQAITETESEELIETESEELIETESELSEESQEEKKYPLSDESTTVEMIDESLELL